MFSINKNFEKSRSQVLSGIDALNDQARKATGNKKSRLEKEAAKLSSEWLKEWGCNGTAEKVMQCIPSRNNLTGRKRRIRVKRKKVNA